MYSLGQIKRLHSVHSLPGVTLGNTDRRWEGYGEVLGVEGFGRDKLWKGEGRALEEKKVER